MKNYIILCVSFTQIHTIHNLVYELSLHYWIKFVPNNQDSVYVHKDNVHNAYNVRKYSDSHEPQFNISLFKISQ